MQFGRLGAGFGRLGAISRKQFDSKSSAIFAAMSPAPSGARKLVIDTYVRALTSSSIWTELDRLFVLAAHSQQAALIDWIHPTGTGAQAVNSPTFTTDRGFAGNAVDSYVRTNFTPSVGGVKYTQDNASIAVWSLTDTLHALSDIGTVIAPLSFVRSRNLGGNAAYRVNDGSTQTIAVADSSGFYHSQRTTATERALFKNGAPIAATSVASTGVPSSELWICGANATEFSPRQIALSACGSSLAGKELTFYSATLAYMQAVGAS